MEPIQFIGVNELDEPQKALVNKLSTEYYDKIQRSLKNLTSLVIHVKQYEKEGKKSKFSIHIRAIAPTRIFESTKASDWDLTRTLHKAFKDLERQIEHVIKQNATYRKPYF